MEIFHHPRNIIYIDEMCTRPHELIYVPLKPLEWLVDLRQQFFNKFLILHKVFADSLCHDQMYIMTANRLSSKLAARSVNKQRISKLD
jgi:hypothetical protein